jgi:hypothetical protein
MEQDRSIEKAMIRKLAARILAQQRRTIHTRQLW